MLKIVINKPLLIFLIFSFIFLYGYSQTGPGGVEKTNGSSDLSLWLRAEDIDQVNNTNVLVWSDFSGFNNDALSDNGHEPFLKSNIQNGYNMVRFRETNEDYLRVLNDASLNPNSISIFVVGKYSNDSEDWSPFIIKTSDWSWTDGYGIA